MNKCQNIVIEDASRIDCAIFCAEKGVFGQSWYVDISLRGSADESGFLYDFSKLKKMTKAVCDESIDHALIIPLKSPQVEVENLGDDLSKVVMKTKDGEWQYSAPNEAIFGLESEHIDYSALSEFLSAEILRQLPENISSCDITLREEDSSQGTFFRYTHGLFEYDGLCQRIFHGHRSKINVYKNNTLDPELTHWACHNVLSPTTHIACERQISDEDDHSYYLTGRGERPITAKVPKSRLKIVGYETSIESISEFVAKEISYKLQDPTHIKVQAYEGIQKSAISERLT